ncbi:MAG: hypothetical protein ACHQ7H_04130 [Candidatus Rokuibacteriota bacterium]
MALYVVERDLNDVPPEQLRLDQRDVASACIHLKSQGKRIRYMSSAVVPTDGRSLDLFGADSDEVVKEAHTAAGVHYIRVVEILDLTPNFVQRGTSRPRRALQRAAAGADISGNAKGAPYTMTANSAPELTRWLADGQRLFGVCLETLENFARLQSENDMLREEVARLRHRVDVLQTDRAEMVAAFNDLAGHVTQVVDHIIQKSENGEGVK